MIPFIVSLVGICGVYALMKLFDYFERDIFYDRKRCEEIISHYTGDEKMKILRALSDNALKPSDIKRYFISGKCGCPASQEYILINRLTQPNHYIDITTKDEPIVVSLDSPRSDYIVKKQLSGSSHSLLRSVELEIVDGKRTITEYWVCA